MSEPAVLEAPSTPPPSAPDPAMADPFASYDEGAVPTGPVRDTPTQDTSKAAPRPADKPKPALENKEPKVGKPPVDKTPLPEKKEEAKAPEKPADDKPKVVDVDKDFSNAPKPLREHAKMLEKKLKDNEARYKSELEQARKSAAPKDDPEKATLAQKLAEAEKRYQAHEDKIRYQDYQQSDEFQTKHYQPYVNLVKRAEASLMEYRVNNADGTQRNPTPEDLWKVIGAASQPDARKIAKELFGDDDAHDIMAWRSNIRNANLEMEAAKAEFRKTGALKLAEQNQQTQAQQQKMAADWKAMNEQAVEKYPQWFKADENDADGQALLDKDFAAADKAFADDANSTPEERLRLHSALRNKAGAFRFVARKLDKATKRVSELEAELEQYKNSEPKGGAVAGDKKGDDEGLADPFSKFENERAA